jgi:hypothetical protein
VFGATAATAQTVMTSTQLKCAAPALDAGPALVRVTNNAVDYTADYAPYLVQSAFLRCQVGDHRLTRLASRSCAQ